MALKSKTIRRLAKKSIADINAQLSKHQITALDEADLKLAGKNIVYMNSGGQPTASNAARLLATRSAQSGRNVVLCDTTGQVQKEITIKTKSEDAAFPIHNINENISLMTAALNSSFFTSKTFNTTIKDLTGRYDQMFICTSNKNAHLGLMALLRFSPGLVMISGLRKTKKSDISSIKSKHPIDLLFYD